MTKSRIETQRVLASAFTSYDGELEPDEFLASVVVCVADEIDMLAGALENDDQCRPTAVRCLRRAVDRLRLAISFPAKIPEDEEISSSVCSTQPNTKSSEVPNQRA